MLGIAKYYYNPKTVRRIIIHLFFDIYDIRYMIYVSTNSYLFRDCYTHMDPYAPRLLAFTSTNGQSCWYMYHAIHIMG